MKRSAFSLLMVAVLGSAVVAQDGLRTARLPDWQRRVWPAE